MTELVELLREGDTLGDGISGDGTLAAVVVSLGDTEDSVEGEVDGVI